MKTADLIKAHVLQVWRMLGILGENRRVVVYGEGTHTEWLHAIVTGIEGPSIAAVLDDTPDNTSCYWGRRQIKPEAWTPSPDDVIVIFSDTANVHIKQRCIDLYGTIPCLLDLYEGFPPGSHHIPHFTPTASQPGLQPQPDNHRLQKPSLYGRITIKDSHSGVRLLDYQQAPVNKFLSHLSGNASAILEIGSDLDCAVVEFLASRFDGIVSGINPSHQFASTLQKKSPNSFPVRADGEMLPFKDNSFDAILSITTLEHVNNIDALLKESYRVLRPGGFFFTFFGPIWSCAVGHHICVRMEGKEMRFWRPDRNLIPDFAHLLLSRDELRTCLREGPCDDRLIESALDWIYDDPKINRLFFDDYKNIVHNQEFDVELFEGTERGASLPPSAEIRKQLENRCPHNKNFRTAKLEFLLRKPQVTACQNIRREETMEDFYSKLCCPLSCEPLQYEPSSNRLTAHHANVAFPLQDGIPVLLPDKAIKLH